MNPTVALDMFGCDRVPPTGWERYATILYSALSSDPRIEVAAINSPSPGGPARRGAEALWHFSHLRDPVVASHAALYHSPSFPLLTHPGVPTVWSVHDDLIVGGHPQYASRGTRYWKYAGGRCLALADAIVTSTRASARDLERVGAHSEKIHVIHPPQPTVPPAGAPPILVDAHGTPVPFPEEFFLSVGTIEERKRPALAAAIAGKAKMPLVFVGRPRGVDPQDLPGQSYFATEAGDSQLSWCYAHARALLAVSDYEGIDLPLFEALSAGLPVLASPIDVHIELASGYVSVLNETDPVGSALRALREMPERANKVTPLSTPGDLAAAHVTLYEALLSH